MVQLKEILRISNKAVIFAILIVIISFFLSIVPCPVTMGSFVTNGFCKLPSPFKTLPEATANFYWISDNPLTGLVMQFLVVSIGYLIIYIIIKRKSLGKKKSKIIDLTKKE